MFTDQTYSIIFIIWTIYLNLDIYLEIGKKYYESWSKFRGLRLSFLVSSEVVFFYLGDLLDIAIISKNQSKQYFKDAENNSSMNSHNGDQHQRRLYELVE